MNDIFDLACEEPAATYDNTARLMPELPWLEQLNPEQKLAATTTEGPFAGAFGRRHRQDQSADRPAGLYLGHHEKQNPWNCLVVTFTNRAAREMQNRAHGLIGNIADSVWMGTFHGIAAKILRRHAEVVGLKSNFTILGEDDQRRLIKQILEAEGIDDKEISAAINFGQDPAMEGQRVDRG